MRIRSIYLGVVLLGATVGGAVQAQQPYPSKPIRIVVAYAAGQGTDIATRYLADQMGKDLGQPIVVENKPGAGGNLGTEMTALAAPDGYTLTMGTNATHALNAFLYAKVPFEAERDFEPIGLVGTFPMIVAVNANAPQTGAFLSPSATRVGAGESGLRTAGAGSASGIGPLTSANVSRISIACRARLCSMQV